MTCIVGLQDGGRVYIGGDSAGVSGHSVQIRADEKVFRVGEFLIGFTTSFRMGQLLRYGFKPPEHPDGMEDMMFMVSVFVPAVRECFKDGGFQKSANGQDEGGSFLVGYRGNLYQIESDYQVGIPADGVAAVGCGMEIALGAMWAARGRPRSRVSKALEAAAHLTSGVRPPFTVMSIS